MSKHRGVVRILLLVGLPVVVLSMGVRAQEPASTSAVEAEENRERLAVERYLALLEKNPRRGTALDRIYGYHVERGTLDAFVKRFEDRARQDPKDGSAWMILGLLEAQRGRDAAAVHAFEKAEANRPTDALAPYYLGQALVLVGRPDEAAGAFERAIERKPARTDLLEIFQALGRVYQRAQKTTEALAVWSRLDKLFPNDLRVQEQIAAALAEEGQASAALPRYEDLARKIRDPFRQVQLTMTAADLKLRLGQTEPALRDFERLLGQLRPDSWLYREVRHKIEDAFLRNDDPAGLAHYYEEWVAKHPEDVDALVRLGRTLASQGRTAEAQTWYEKAVKLAPSRRDLRLALISQLVQEKKTEAASKQYEELVKAEPNNPDLLRDWGVLLLHDTSKPEAERQAAATAVWRKLLDARPNDPVTAAQVADLFRQAELIDDALVLYRKAIALAPGNPQYHEYLGEYLHALKRSDEARAAWAEIAAGANRNARNLTRLAEVLAGFGYLNEAVTPLTEAVALEGDDFGLRLKLADYLHRTEQFDAARKQLDEADRLAESEEEKRAALEAQVKNDQDGGQLAARIEALTREVEGKPDAPTERRVRLARYLEAAGKLPESLAVLDAAVAADPRSVAAWTSSARVCEATGNLGAAADAYRKLAEIDRRNRTEYLTGVARLEARLGRIEEALKAGRDLIAAAPGNPEHYEFFAELCLQLGRTDEGLDTLRRAVRVNPNEIRVVLTLAGHLAEQFRTEEAIEMYWRAFDKATELDAKVGIIPRLTELYLLRNQLDRLLSRLQREQTESQQPQRQRELAICLAQAYASSGDLGSARSELERLLAANARDLPLLQQLSKLSEEEGDFESAAKFLKQALEVAPDEQAEERLAQLYARLGELSEAQAIWTKQANEQADSYRVYQAIDRLQANGKAESALAVTESLLRKDPANWEALYREGVALASLNKPDEARDRFRRLLDLKHDDDDKSALARARGRDPKLQSTGARPSSVTAQVKPTPFMERTQAVSQIRAVTGLDPRIIYGYAASATGNAMSWSPADYGQARIAALGWILGLDRKRSRPVEQTLADLQQPWSKTPGDPRALQQAYDLARLQNDVPAIQKAALELSRAQPDDPDAAFCYLSSLAARSNPNATSGLIVQGAERQDPNAPLPPNEVDHMMSCVRLVRQRRPELFLGVLVGVVDEELRRAGRIQEADALYKDLVDSVQQLGPVASMLNVAARRGDVESLIRLFDRYTRLQTSAAGPTILGGSYYFRGPAYDLAQAMGSLATAKNDNEILRLLDHYLAHARRQAEMQAASGRSTRSTPTYPSGTTLSYQIYIGRQTRMVRVTFPTPNAYYDAGAITLLRNAYEHYKRDDLASDLIGHFRRQAAAARSPAEALFPRLALSYLLWWEDEKEAALAEYKQAIETTPPEAAIRQTLADLYEQNGDLAEALAVVDAFKPLDNTLMQTRENQAFRLALLTGNIARAREAAERLFGQRLDTESQIRLASQMHQLGMQDLAESVLARARRRAGSKVSVLVGLMMEYQRQDDSDRAAQVAMQILRGTAAAPASNPNVFNPNDPTAARNAAIQVLARSGRLKDLIERAEDQVKRAPSSVPAHQVLADYYNAAGQADKARDELAKIVELRPDDTNLRYTIAGQLLQEGRFEEAIVHYKAVIQNDPGLLARNFYQVQNAFQRANRMPELFDLVEAADVRAFRSPSYLMNLIRTVISDETLRDRSLALFKRVWDAYPDQRSMFMNYVGSDDFWKLPGMYDFARQAILPDRASMSGGAQWNMFTNTLSYVSDGRVTSALSRFLDLGVEQHKLDDLAQVVQEGLEKAPGWTAGKATLAIIDARAGKPDEARRLIQEVLDRAKEEVIPAQALRILGQELEGQEATRPLAITLYEKSLDDTSNDPFTTLNYNYSPVRRLAEIYRKEGRMDDVRRVIRSLAKPRDFGNSYVDDSYVSQMRLQGLVAAAQALEKLGETAEAAPMFVEAIALGESIPADASNYIGNREGIIQQARDSLTRALEGLKEDQLAGTVQRLLAPRRPASGKARPDEALDLILLVHPRELDKAMLRSLLAEAITACVRKSENRSAIDSALKDLRARDPEDLSVAITTALAVLAEEDRERIASELDRLTRMVEQRPLEVLPPRGRANSRQRQEAARQIPLWLVARACLKSPVESARSYADRFAARAIEAGQRQADSRWVLAMLREQGQFELDRNNTTAAEAAWSRMLDQILTHDQPGAKPATNPTAIPGTVVPATPLRPATPAPAAPGTTTTKAAVIRRTAYQIRSTEKAAEAPRPAPAPSARSSPTTVPPSTPAPAPGQSGVVTLDRFEQAMQVARLAAEHDMPALSFRAVRETLGGGPPILTSPQASGVLVGSSFTMPMTTRMRSGLAEIDRADPVAPRVVAPMTELEAIWRSRGAPADAVYEALKAAVLPAGRPAEIFLYPTPLQSTPAAPTGLSGLLCDWAVRARKVEDLRAAIQARRALPQAAFAAAVLDAQLALVTKDTDGVNQALHELAERLRTNSSRWAAEQASQIALLAIRGDKISAAAAEVLDQALKSLDGSAGNLGNNSPLQAILPLVARYQFQTGDAEGGRKRLRDYLAMRERETLSAGAGDYPVFLRRLALQTVAAEFARAGMTADALELLGRYADAPEPATQYYTSVPLNVALMPVLRQLARQPSRERYETLRAWTLPTSTRRLVRVLTCEGTVDDPSIVLEARRGTEANPAGDRLASTITMLVAAAREVGALEDLAAAARTAQEDKVENANVLAALVDQARGRDDALAKLLTSRIEATNPKNPQAGTAPPGAAVTTFPAEIVRANRISAFSWTDCLLAHLAMEADKPELRQQGLALARQLHSRLQQTELRTASSILSEDMALARARDQAGKTLTEDRDGSLALWRPGGWSYGLAQASMEAPPRWVAQEGHITQLAGINPEMLLLDVPLTGRFTFHVDGYADFQFASGIAFQGLVIGDAGSFGAMGGLELVQRRWPFQRVGFNRYSIEVEPGVTRYRINGRLYLEDKNPSPTNPWLGLFSAGRDPRFWRHPRIEGTPTIPAEVRLTHEDRLEGWISSFYGESVPLRWTEMRADENGNMRSLPRPVADWNQALASPIDPSQYDWCAVDGVIHGRRGRDTASNRPVGSSSGPSTNQSRLYYIRPLQDGDELTYEFYYDPDTVMVHPALGRRVFLLEPDGVRLHWLTEATQDFAGLASGIVPEEPENRRGPARLPLREKSWNQLRLRLKNEAGTNPDSKPARLIVTLILNDQPIYEHPVEAGSRQFGFFHDKSRTAAQARNVVLRGGWPTSPEILKATNLLARRPGTPDSEADRRARHAVIGEEYFGLDADTLVERTRTLKPDERYEALRSWVLPGADHPTFRLVGGFLPTDAVGAVPAGDGRRVQVPGDLIAPALDLVEVAQELGRLDALSRQVESAPAWGTANEQGRDVLRVLIAVARKDDEAARAILSNLKLVPGQEAPAIESGVRMWPILVAATAASRRPALREPSIALLDRLAEENEKQVVRPWLPELAVKNLRARLRLSQAEPAASRVEPSNGVWDRVTFATAMTRGLGHPAPIWTDQNGLITHHPGHGQDELMLRVPIQGDFTVEAELTAYDPDAMRAGRPERSSELAAWLRYAGTYVDGRSVSKIGKLGEWYRVKLDVRNGVVVWTIDEHEVLRTNVPTGSSPWLTLSALNRHSGRLRNLKITGHPVIPRELDLTALADVRRAGWKPTYYSETLLASEGRPGNADWYRDGEEVVGPLMENAPGLKRESLLSYERPLIENGEITYRFYYVTGKDMVHPALDRLAFLIEPEGVKVHWLTDGAYERTGLAPDNVVVEPKNRRGESPLPLKPNDWNAMTVSLTGDTIRLTLNGTLIYERALEATNQRVFSFFHYADETRARIRSVTYRGDWPKTLPDELRPVEADRGANEL